VEAASLEVLPDNIKTTVNGMQKIVSYPASLDWQSVSDRFEFESGWPRPQIIDHAEYFVA
jgi:hypothetical protein